MDEISGLEPLLVFRLAAFRWESLMLSAIKVGQSPGGYIARLELFRVGRRLLETPADNLKTLLCRRRAPRRLDSSDDVFQPIQRLACP